MKKLFTILGVFLSATVFAEGYQVNLQSTRQAGMGHVGTAMKLGAESMHFNPAGLIYMDDKVDLSFGASAVATDVTYRGEGGYHANTDNSISTPMYFYAGFNVWKDMIAAGLSVTTPYGSSLSWGNNWKGAAAVQNIALKSFVFQPTISLELVEGLSIGAGLMVATGNFSLSKAVLPAGYMVQYPTFGEDYKDVVPVSVHLKGSSNVRVGYNVGVMWQPCKKIILGASYRSKIRMTVDNGEAALEYANSKIQSTISEIVSLLDNGTFAASLPLPSNWNFGVSYMPTDRWVVAFDLQYVGWKAYDRLVVDFKENMLNDNDQDLKKDYKNTFVYRLGAQWQASKALQVRLGAYFDETPVRCDYYNPETPGANKLGVSAGLSYEPVRNMTLDLAFTFIKGFKREGSYEYLPPMTGSFSGEYESTAYVPSLGVSVRF